MFIPALVIAQEKVEAPVWNVGDKWVFTQGIIEIIDADQNSYTMKFPSDKTNAWFLESGGFAKIIFDNGNLNRIYALKENKREKYTGFRRTHLNFPLSSGKKWKDTFPSKVLVGYHTDDRVLEYTETYEILGWEEIEIRAGKFKAIKLGCEYSITGPPGYMGQVVGSTNKAWYWYSPTGKYFVKCEYEKHTLGAMGLKDWELTSFEGKK
jgi:hypothetical protein